MAKWDMYEDLDDTRTKIALCDGMSNVLTQTAEECSELSATVLHAKRVICCEGQQTNERIKDVKSKVYSEVTDVLLMVQELMLLMDLKPEIIEIVKAEKIKRTCERMGIK